MSSASFLSRHRSSRRGACWDTWHKLDDPSRYDDDEAAFTRPHLIRFIFTGASPVIIRFCVLHINHFNVESLGISCVSGWLFDGITRVTFRNSRVKSTMPTFGTKQ